ncbi:MAG TPA: hypothetical protein VK427_26470, partial [Kofleriaceae bacterium]|nr:hypothetical protein [Kofleriaceae bacterium]
MTDPITLSRSPDGPIQGALTAQGSVALMWTAHHEPRWVRFPGETFTSPPVVTADRTGQLWMFARGTNGELCVNTRKPTEGWSGFSFVPSTEIIGTPSACLDADGRVLVVVRGTNSAIYSRTFDGTWSDWVGLGGATTDSPAVVLDRDGHLNVFIRGTDDAIYCSTFDGAWSGWQRTGDGYTNAAPCAALDGIGRLHVFVRGTNNQLYVQRKDRAGWTPWASLGGGLATGPAAALDNQGALLVRVVGTDDTTIHQRLCVSGWEDYTAVSARPGFMPIEHPEVASIRVATDTVAQNPTVRAIAEHAFDTFRVAFARAVLSVQPGQPAAVGEIEESLATWYRQRSPKKHAKLTAIAKAEIARADELRAQRPELWKHIDVQADRPVVDQGMMTHVLDAIRGPSWKDEIAQL